MSKICDECETVAHCTKHGCIPKVSAKDAMKLGLEALEDFEDAIRYDNEQHDIGARVCCDVLSYNPHTKDCKALKAITALRAALAEQPAPAQQGWTPNMPITEEMHRAACKVLTRANGLDGTPQRMINAMLAAAPQPAQGEKK